jgi:hypothetical protein
VLLRHDELPSGLKPGVLEEITEAGSWRQRFAVLDREPLARLGERRHDPRYDVRPEVAQAWRELEEHHGAVPIGVVADRLG